MISLRARGGGVRASVRRDAALRFAVINAEATDRRRRVLTDGESRVDERRQKGEKERYERKRRKAVLKDSRAAQKLNSWNTHGGVYIKPRGKSRLGEETRRVVAMNSEASAAPVFCLRIRVSYIVIENNLEKSPNFSYFSRRNAILFYATQISRKVNPTSASSENARGAAN